ncbi:Fe(3+) dicitrate transport ATP-binding protein FecE [Carnimonas sp. R-84981]|uniref:ABC transporter ATP-binding protein n=1 Tax=Carnimonas bestiolae TaxID=3402172 RepID=UPI003EDC2B62
MSLAVNALSFRAGNVDILRGVSIAPLTQRLTGVLGPNGSGKSTLLRLLAGLSSPSGGHVSLDNVALSHWRKRERAKRIALVEQQAATGLDLRVIDVVRLGRIPWRKAFAGQDAEDDQAVEQALEWTHLSHLRQRRWQHLSGGEQQRTQLARALAQSASELLLDEPTNHLDIHHQLELLELLKTLPARSVVALHDLNLAAMFCDRLILLDRGAVVADGAPAEVLTHQHILDVYGVDAQVTPDPLGGCTIAYRRLRGAGGNTQGAGR